jgi:uncharacterized protein with HEPN domain
MRPEELNAAYLWDMLSAAREVCDMLQGFSVERFQAAKQGYRTIEIAVRRFIAGCGEVNLSELLANPRAGALASNHGWQ